MAVTIECPRCSHTQKIDDTKAGKDVPCKICHHLIQSSGKAEKTNSKLAATDKADRDGRVHAGPPKVEAAGARSKAPKNANNNDDDEVPEKRRPVLRRREATGSGAGLGLLLIGGGVFVILFLFCGGLGLGGFLTFRSAAKPEEQVAKNDKQEDAPKADPGPNPVPPPQPPFDPPPQPPFNPPPFEPPPPPLTLNPKDPNEIEKAIALLGGVDNDRETAYHWFTQADANHPRRPDAARELEKLVDTELKRPFTKFFDAYFRWYTKDNANSLIRFAESTAFTPWDNDRRQKSMLALGQLKEPRAVANIASKLNNAFDGDTAYKALAEMGPVAQGELLKHMNHPDGRTRDRARTLLQGYNTNPQLYFAQTLIDLEAADNNRRNSALQWLAKTPVDAKRKPEVARALNKSLDNPDCLRNGDLATALENWATAENVAKLAQVLDQSRFGNAAAIKILNKIGDADSLKAIAHSLANNFQANDAKNALKGHGAKAEPAVIEMLNQANTPKDRRLRDDCVRLLGEIGTRNVSGVALQQLALRNPNDRTLGMMIAQSLIAINGRGK